MSATGEAPIVPLLVLGDGRRRALQERLEGIVRAWHRGWASEGVPEPAVSLVGDPLEQEPRGTTVALLAKHEQENLACAIATVDIARALVGTGVGEGTLAATIAPADGMSLSLVEGAIRALCGEIVQSAFPGAPCELERQRGPLAECCPAPLRERGVAVTVTVGRPRPALELVLSPRLADALAGGRPAVVNGERLAARRRAIGEARVRVSVQLGAAAVPWRELTALAAGDVVVLDQSLESPCLLFVDGGARIGEARLGALGGALAVQISRVTPEAPPTSA